MPRYEDEEWTDKDGNPFTVQVVTEDHSTYVNGAPADVHKGDRLIGAGSSGFYPFDADVYQNDHGAQPPSDDDQVQVEDDEDGEDSPENDRG